MSIRTLPIKLQDIAQKYLNEIPSKNEEDIRYLREWLRQQPHIIARTDDQWLLNFLRGCKFQLQRTKEKLDMFYTVKTALSEFYLQRDPLQEEIQEVLKLGCFLPLLNRETSSQPRLILLRSETVNPSKIKFRSIVKVALMIIDILLNEDDTFIIAGQEILFDLKGMTLDHLVQVTPTVCKKLIVCLQDSYPTRPKIFHIINASTICESLLTMISSLLNDKLKRRIKIYDAQKFSCIYKNIPNSILPKEYGGAGSTLHELTDFWKEKVESYRDWFFYDSQFRVDENKRPEKPITSSDLFGIEGSFRKLVID